MTASARKGRVASDKHVDGGEEDLEIVFSHEDDGGSDAGGVKQDHAGNDGFENTERSPTTAFAPSDTTGMSIVERNMALQSYKRERNRQYQRTSQAAKRARQNEREREVKGGLPLRILSAIRAQAKEGHEAKGAAGFEFSTNVECYYACREIAEV